MEKESKQISGLLTHGIMQGRLTKPRDNILQFFPALNWKAEFDLARSVGFSTIEGVIDGDPMSHPLLQPESGEFLIQRWRRIGQVVMETVCLHHFVIQSFWEYPLFAKLLLDIAKVGIKKVVLPLEGASLGLNYSRTDQERILRTMGEAASAAGVLVLLETADVLRYSSMLAEIKAPSLALNFDIGNISFEHGSEKAIKLFEEIYRDVRGIHLKDKNERGASVPFGCGLVNFRTFLKVVRELHVGVPLIHESYRGQDDDPVVMARQNLVYLRTCLAKL